MFRKLTLPAVLLLAAVAGAPGTTGAAAAPAARTAAPLVESAPLAPSPLASAAAAESVPLAPAQMREAQGDGWLKKLWKKYKKYIRKILEVIINAILDYYFNETNEYVATLASDVTETYEATETTTSTYQNQADYDANRNATTAYANTGWSMTGRMIEPIERDFQQM